MTPAYVDELLAPTTTRLRSLARQRMLQSWIATVTLVAVAFRLIMPDAVTVTLSATACYVLLSFFAFRRRQVPLAPVTTARAIESRFPELNGRLETLVDGERRGHSVMTERLASELHDHPTRSCWPQAVESARVFRSRLLTTATLCLSVTLVWMMPELSPRESGIGPVSVTAAESRGLREVRFSPGSTRHSASESLLIVAKLDEPIVGSADFVLDFADGTQRRVDAISDLGGSALSIRLPEVTHSFSYRLSTPEWDSQRETITLFQRPELFSIDAQVRWPEWTGRDSETLADCRSVAATAGAEVTLVVGASENTRVVECLSDERVTRAERIEPQTAGRQRFRLSHVVQGTTSVRFTALNATDDQSAVPIEFTITSLRNDRPTIRSVFPARDRVVAAMEECRIEGHAADDFGLVEAGVRWTIGDAAPMDVPLSRGEGTLVAADLHTLLCLEEYETPPHTLISYSLYAVDRDSSGRERRTDGDLYFFEVRPSEEIYRQGRQPPGGQSGQSSQSQSGNEVQDLARRQKQVLTGTWNLLSSSESAEPPRADVDTLVRSQRAIESGVRQLRLPRSDHRAVAQQQRLAGAIADSLGNLTSDPPRLRDAVSAQRQAYQALLALQPTDHDIVQGQSNGASGGASANSTSLDKLELEEKRNNYQTRSTSPNEQQDEAEQKLLEDLQRLSRRQSELNHALQKLADASRTAKTEAERAEIERQLKSLRDRLREQMHALDQARSQLPNRDDEQQQQLSQSRQQMQNAAEALSEGQASRAAAAGAKAATSLQQAADGVRSRTGTQTREKLKALADLAEDALREQGALSRGKPQAEGGPARLQTSSDVDHQRIQRQGERLSNLGGQLRNLVQQTADSEPAVSGVLYRGLANNRLEDALRALDRSRQAREKGHDDEANAAAERVTETLRKWQAVIGQAQQLTSTGRAESLTKAKQRVESLKNSLSQSAAGSDQKSAGPTRARRSGRSKNFSRPSVCVQKRPASAVRCGVADRSPGKRPRETVRPRAMNGR